MVFGGSKITEFTYFDSTTAKKNKDKKVAVTSNEPIAPDRFEAKIIDVSYFNEEIVFTIQHNNKLEIVYLYGVKPHRGHNSLKEISDLITFYNNAKTIIVVRNKEYHQVSVKMVLHERIDDLVDEIVIRGLATMSSNCDQRLICQNIGSSQYYAQSHKLGCWNHE